MREAVYNGEECSCQQEHHHHHHDGCSCGHKHEHEHHHHHEECSCENEHHHHEECGCGHEHHHHEHGGCSCGHCHDISVRREEGGTHESHKKELVQLISGAVLFAAGVILEHVHIFPEAGAVVFVAAYLILGLEIIGKALHNLKGGNFLDENFLMGAATIAAFVIGDFAEAVGVMLFYRVGEFFEDVAVERSRAQIASAVDMRPEVVNLVRESGTEEIPAEHAKRGDVLLIRPGDRIPLDGIVLEGESRIDTSPVTGEPVPVRVSPGKEVISGCINEQGVLKMRVEKILSESMVSRILDSVENAAASKPKIDRFITRFARVYTPIVVVAAVLTAVVPSLFTGDWKHWIYTAITFLVISCPCALVLSVPLAFFSGIGAGSRRGILFKGGVAIEALKDVKAVVMDKTGTVTKGSFEVREILTQGSLEAERLLGMAAACEKNSTHPIGVSIVREAKRRGLTMPDALETEEISGKGIRAVFPEHTVLCGSAGLLEMYGVKVKDYNGSLYGTKVFVAVDDAQEGCLVIADQVKDDASASIAEMKRQGLTTVMLTGDAADSAHAVAQETGIGEVHAGLLPQEKLEHLQDIRRRQGEVLFVGDGINDAPVLAGADVGAAMGSGADAAIEAADVVFMNSALGAVPEAVSIARATGRIAMQNVVFALGVKLLVMLLGFAGFANMWLAVFADSGVAMLCVLNSIRILWRK